jgi:hypothetical protein
MNSTVPAHLRNLDRKLTNELDGRKPIILQMQNRVITLSKADVEIHFLNPEGEANENHILLANEFRAMGTNLAEVVENKEAFRFKMTWKTDEDPNTQTVVMGYDPEKGAATGKYVLALLAVSFSNPQLIPPKSIRIHEFGQEDSVKWLLDHPRN